jgi:hypothetical protein
VLPRALKNTGAWRVARGVQQEVGQHWLVPLRSVARAPVALPLTARRPTLALPRALELRPEPLDRGPTARPLSRRADLRAPTPARSARSRAHEENRLSPACLPGRPHRAVYRVVFGPLPALWFHPVDGGWRRARSTVGSEACRPVVGVISRVAAPAQARGAGVAGAMATSFG